MASRNYNPPSAKDIRKVLHNMDRAVQYLETAANLLKIAAHRLASPEEVLKRLQKMNRKRG